MKVYKDEAINPMP